MTSQNIVQLDVQKRDQNQKPRSTERNSGGGGIFPPLSAVSIERFSDRDVITFENVLPREDSYSDDHSVFANGEYFEIISRSGVHVA